MKEPLSIYWRHWESKDLLEKCNTKGTLCSDNSFSNSFERQFRRAEANFNTADGMW